MKPKFKLNQQVSMEGRTDDLFITEVDVPACSCVGEGHENEASEIYYIINDQFVAKESDLKKLLP
jgi:hypothetical protein